MKLLIVLPSLVAEGCPMLALQVSQYAKTTLSADIALLVLDKQSTDLFPAFSQICSKIYFFSSSEPLKYPRLFLTIYQCLHSFRPTHTICYPFGWHAFVGFFSFLLLRQRVVTHIGNLPPVWTGFSFYKFLILVQLGRPFTFSHVACSKYIAEASSRDFKLPPASIATIYNSFDFTRIHPVCKLRFPRKDISIVMVARLEPHKDHITLLRAFSLLDNKYSYRLHLVGDGSQRPLLLDLVNKLGIADLVQFHGSLVDISPVLSSADLFIFSVRPDEGFGIALAEALAAGIPTISSNVGAVREVTCNGEYGYLFDYQDHVSLASVISYALDNSTTTLRISYQAQHYSWETFSSKQMCESYLNLLLSA